MENEQNFVNCPYCGERNHFYATVCKCGYFFQQEEYKQDLKKRDNQLIGKEKEIQILKQDKDNSFFAPEKAVVKNNPLGGGLLLMIIAVVWFVVGYESGLIFFYPPILFLFGLIAFLRGLINGNRVTEDKID